MEGGGEEGLPKDYYKVLEVGYDATEEDIRISYRRLALKWHPDKHQGSIDVTAKFQEINEAYRVLGDPDKRTDYDISGDYQINSYTLREYLSRFKGMILTCNGLGIDHIPTWTHHLQLTTLDHVNNWNRSILKFRHATPLCKRSCSTRTGHAGHCHCKRRKNVVNEESRV